MLSLNLPKTRPRCCSSGYSLSCLHRTLRTRFLQRPWLSSMQQPQAENFNRNRKRSLHRQSPAQPASAGPPGFDSLRLQDGVSVRPHAQSGHKQARLQHNSYRPGVVSAVAGLEQPAAPAAAGARTSSTTRAHLTEVRFGELPICSATKRYYSPVTCCD